MLRPTKVSDRWCRKSVQQKTPDATAAGVDDILSWIPGSQWLILRSYKGMAAGRFSSFCFRLVQRFDLEEGHVVCEGSFEVIGDAGADLGEDAVGISRG